MDNHLDLTAKSNGLFRKGVSHYDIDEYEAAIEYFFAGLTVLLKAMRSSDCGPSMKETHKKKAHDMLSRIIFAEELRFAWEALSSPSATVTVPTFNSIKHLIALLDADPTDDLAWATLGLCMGSNERVVIGRTFTQKQCYIRSLELGPFQYIVWDMLSRILKEGESATVCGKHFSAVECSERAGRAGDGDGSPTDQGVFLFQKAAAYDEGKEYRPAYNDYLFAILKFHEAIRKDAATRELLRKSQEADRGAAESELLRKLYEASRSEECGAAKSELLRKKIREILGRVDGLRNFLDANSTETNATAVALPIAASSLIVTLSEDPSDDVAWAALAQCIGSEHVVIGGKTFTQKQCFITSLELNPAFWWPFLGRVLAKSMDTNDATLVAGKLYSKQDALLEALRCDTADAGTWFDIAKNMEANSTEHETINGKQYTQAECYAEVVRIKPDNVSAWRNVAWSLNEDANVSIHEKTFTKVECCLEALQRDATSHRMWRTLGFAMAPDVPVSLLGKTYTRRECMLKGVCDNPSCAPCIGTRGWAMNLDENMTVNGKSFSALDCCLESLRLDPEAPRVWHLLGYLLGLGALRGSAFIAGKTYTSQGCFLEALRLHSDYAGAWDALGETMAVSERISVGGVTYSKAECRAKGSGHKTVYPTYSSNAQQPLRVTGHPDSSSMTTSTNVGASFPAGNANEPPPLSGSAFSGVHYSDPNNGETRTVLEAVEPPRRYDPPTDTIVFLSKFAARSWVPHFHFQVMAAVRMIVDAYAVSNSIAPSEKDAFLLRFLRHVFSNVALGAIDDVLEPASCPEIAAKLISSSNERLAGKAFITLLNEAVRKDASPAVESAVTIAHILDSCLVKPEQTWPLVAQGLPPPRPTPTCTYRGGTMPRQHRDFFHPGKRYRAPMYVSTNSNLHAAEDFIAINSAGASQLPPFTEPVLWTFHFDPLDQLQSCIDIPADGDRGAGLMFKPYSVFTVRSVVWENDHPAVSDVFFQRHHRIDVDATRHQGGNGFPEPPLAPWC